MRSEHFHAVTLAVYPLLLIVLAMITQHPLYLAALLLVTLLALRRGGGTKSMWQMLRFTWPFLLIILILNVLISKNGATVLYDGPRLPLLGALRITLEATLFGLIMALRLFLVLAACNLYLVWLSPDRALGLMAKWAGRSAVVAMLTARLIPFLSEQAKSVGDVMRTRGVRFQEGSTRERLQKHGRMLNVLLISSLEGSWQVAEAMEARGFGSRRRSSYTRERFGRQDWLIWAVMLAVLWTMFLLTDLDASTYEFYPRLTPLLAAGSLTWGGALLLGALLAAVPLLIQRRSN